MVELLRGVALPLSTNSGIGLVGGFSCAGGGPARWRRRLIWKNGWAQIPWRPMKQNWKNQTMWTGDNLDILRGMNSESVDLIYLDPPFNSNRTYSAPIGCKAAGAA